MSLMNLDYRALDEEVRGIHRTMPERGHDLALRLKFNAMKVDGEYRYQNAVATVYKPEGDRWLCGIRTDRGTLVHTAAHKTLDHALVDALNRDT